MKNVIIYYNFVIREPNDFMADYISSMSILFENMTSLPRSHLTWEKICFELWVILAFFSKVLNPPGGATVLDNVI